MLLCCGFSLGNNALANEFGQIMGSSVPRRAKRSVSSAQARPATRSPEGLTCVAHFERGAAGTARSSLSSGARRQLGPGSLHGGSVFSRTLGRVANAFLTASVSSGSCIRATIASISASNSARAAIVAAGRCSVPGALAKERPGPRAWRRSLGSAVIVRSVRDRESTIITIA
jgi:hypothetical protein